MTLYVLQSRDPDDDSREEIEADDVRLVDERILFVQAGHVFRRESAADYTVGPGDPTVYDSTLGLIED
ncbi:MAG: hypothetical protein QM757_14705 [Paludibaculum sp.]